MRRTSAWSRSAGFTLVEALLATMLMVIILGALATVTGQWMPSWDRGFVRLQRAELLAAGLERLIADLAAAEIVSAGSGPNDNPIFDGTELSVTFIRTMLGPNDSTGLEVVQIAETRDDSGLALARRTAPFAPMLGATGQGDQPNFANPVVVIRAPYRVSFSYAGRDRIWRDNWRGSAQLPHAIRVRVRDAATSTTLAVSTSTLVHAELPARCTGVKTNARCPSFDQPTKSAGTGGFLER
jgi:general secretion pathway protein J